MRITYRDVIDRSVERLPFNASVHLRLAAEYMAVSVRWLIANRKSLGLTTERDAVIAMGSPDPGSQADEWFFAGQLVDAKRDFDQKRLQALNELSALSQELGMED
jgi:hypothetical protein